MHVEGGKAIRHMGFYDFRPLSEPRGKVSEQVAKRDDILFWISTPAMGDPSLVKVLIRMLPSVANRWVPYLILRCVETSGLLNEHTWHETGAVCSFVKFVLSWGLIRFSGKRHTLGLSLARATVHPTSHGTKTKGQFATPPHPKGVGWRIGPPSTYVCENTRPDYLWWYDLPIQLWDIWPLEERELNREEVDLRHMTVGHMACDRYPPNREGVDLKHMAFMNHHHSL